jgi:hypothetical protein
MSTNAFAQYERAEAHASSVADNIRREYAEHRADMTEVAILRWRVEMLRQYVASEKAAGWDHVPIASLEVYLGVNGSAK